jgi:hypothetical protein
MCHQNELPEDEKFSDDPEENLRMQNDFLKMKMLAESGANTDAKASGIFEILGKPFFEEEQNLNDDQFETEFKKLQELLLKSGINVDFNRERNDRFKYNFITKELFQHDPTFEPVKGMSTYFLYEEFHPDHKLDMIDQTHDFLNDFFERKLSSESYYLSHQIIEPDGKIIPSQEIIKRFQTMYEAIPEFENTSFSLENQDFELNESETGITGMGFTEGTIHYNFIFTDGERKKINGPFKIFFSREYDCWNICFFYLAGFNLHPHKREEE